MKAVAYEFGQDGTVSLRNRLHERAVERHVRLENCPVHWLQGVVYTGIAAARHACASGELNQRNGCQQRDQHAQCEAPCARVRLAHTQCGILPWLVTLGTL